MKDQNNYKGLSVLDSIKAYEAKKDELINDWQFPLKEKIVNEISDRAEELDPERSVDDCCCVTLPFALFHKCDGKTNAEYYFRGLKVDKCDFIYLVDFRGGEPVRVYDFDEMVQLYHHLHLMGFFDKSKEQYFQKT